MLERATRMAGRGTLRLGARLLPSRGEKGLWVFGAVSGREYCDNSRALFEHVLAVRSDVTPVWQIDADSPDVERLPAGARWVDRRSLEAHRLTRAAEVVVFSHGTHDVAGLYGNRHGVVVRLGHGLTAFGRSRGATPISLRRMVQRVSLAPVASEFERANKRDWGFADRQLPVTGLPRWDRLRELRASSTGRETVLFAPTWRRWLRPGDFEQSDYWHHVRAFLTNDVIREQLRADGLRLAVFAHPAVRSMLADRLGTHSVEVVGSGEEVPAVLARSALFITDWSSIAFDALTIRVPTAFYQFELDRYLAERGSYVDLRQPLFGPSTSDLEDLAGIIQSFTESGRSFPAFDDRVRRWAGELFAFEDSDNCARVVSAIDHCRAR